MAADRSELTIQDVVTQLFQDREYARQNGAASAALAATMGIAKVLGLIVDKSEAKNQLTVDDSVKPRWRKAAKAWRRA